jgi:phospholipid transport system substrate-binding protein
MIRALNRALLIGLFTLITPLWAVGNFATPDQLVSDTAGKILTQINANYDAYSENPELLGEVVRADMLPLLDMEYTARLILGRSGREASQAQITAFTDAMTRLLVDRYSTGLMSFRSQDQLEVLPLRGELNERMTRVRTRVKMESGGFAPVDYVFRKTGEGWKVFDVIIEGISYVTTYRNQIIPEIQANGLDAVIERLNNGELVLQD